jgi:exodeoxyribonuclease-3
MRWVKLTLPCPGPAEVAVDDLAVDLEQLGRDATWNVNSLNARLPRVMEWLSTVRPDVLCLQETKLADSSFPALDFLSIGYESVHHGNGQWNGVAILSRVGIDSVCAGFDDGEPPDRDTRLIWATCGGVRVGSVYVPNGRSREDEHYQYKLHWLRRLRRHLDMHHSPDELLVLLGDWNIAPTDQDVWDPRAFEGSTHVSADERAALHDLQSWGLVDVFRARYHSDGLFSYWDYRGGDFHQRRGMRIDYLLASTALASLSRGDLIDRNARKGTKPSDHAPVVGLFSLEADS